MIIATLNLYFKQHGQEKIDALVNYFSQTNPDIVAFQEAVEEEVLEVKKRLGFAGNGYYLYEGWEDDEKTLKVTSGTAILYREDVVKISGVGHIVVDVPEKLDGGMNKSYSCLYSVFNIKERKFGVVSTHFSVNYDDRMKEVRVLNDYIEEKLFGIDGLILLGDFNNNKMGDSYNAEQYFEDQGYTDVWKELNPGITCVTYRGVDWWKKNYPDHKQTKKYVRKNESFEDDALDFTFYRGNLKFKSISTLDLTPIVSDHLGLIADFNLN